jgi:(2R)-3-sulfolactate dehydrogenase (NADP+)
MTAMTETELAGLAEKALLAHGASLAQARPLAMAIAAAERDGVRSHGLMYLPTYCSHLAVGKVVGTAEPVMTRPAPGVVIVDAGSGFAHPAIGMGLPPLLEAAATQGLACLAVRNSYNCGILGHHTETIAQAGFVGLGFTNAPASIAPWGARKPVVGTNPWSLAVPDGRGAVRFVIDQSASVVAKSEVIKRSKSGEAIPEGWAFDAEGRPTTDAAIALKGTMAPAGGYKGVGAAILVEVFAACLAGATLGVHASPFSGPDGGPPRTGQFFLAIDPRATSGGGYAERIEALALALAAETGGRLPGGRKMAARAKAAAHGVEVDDGSLAMLTSLASGPTA